MFVLSSYFNDPLDTIESVLVAQTKVICQGMDVKGNSITKRMSFNYCFVVVNKMVDGYDFKIKS